MDRKCATDERSPTDDVILAFDRERTLPIPDKVFNLLVSGIDLSSDEWFEIFDAHAGAPSLRRDTFFDETAQDQINWLASGIAENDSLQGGQDSHAANEALAGRVARMPDLLRLAIIEVIERFWTRQHAGGSREKILQGLAVPSCETAHHRVHALPRQEHLHQLLTGA